MKSVNPKVVYILHSFQTEIKGSVIVRGQKHSLTFLHSGYILIQYANATGCHVKHTAGLCGCSNCLIRIAQITLLQP